MWDAPGDNDVELSVLKKAGSGQELRNVCCCCCLIQRKDSLVTFMSEMTEELNAVDRFEAFFPGFVMGMMTASLNDK